MVKTKILFFVDSHGSKTAFKKIKKKSQNIDLIVCAGDFTVFEDNMLKILKEFDSLKKPFLIIPGNHEFKQDLKSACTNLKNVVFVDDDFYVFHDIILYFNSEGGFSVKDSLIDKKIKKIKKRFRLFRKEHEISKSVMVFHSPPYGTVLDYKNKEEGHVGSKSKMKLVKKVKPDLVIAGHIHETKYKKEEKDEIKYLNPGPYGRVISL